MLKVNGSGISFEIIGSGMPVVILHGFGVDREIMKGFLEPVFSKNEEYKRIYLDLPGMGKSVASNKLKSSDDMLQVMTEFIQKVVPKEDFLLIGLSYGGYLARGIAARMPHSVKGMNLVCPMIYPFERQVEEHIIRKRDVNFLNSLAEGERNEFVLDAVVQTADVYKRYKNEVIPGVLAGNRSFLESEFRTEYYGFSFDPDEHAETFDEPVLIITGRQDRAVGFKDAMAIAAKYPKATFAVLDFAGHLVQIEQPGIVEQLTKEWLRRCNINQAI